MSIHEYQTFRTKDGHEARVYGTKTIGKTPFFYGTIIDGIGKEGSSFNCWGAWHIDGRDVQGTSDFNLDMSRTKG